jgi:glycosyltransferase involved in cell wall biosynthesis
MADSAPKVAFASTYPPQRCGIGAYTEQLAFALAAFGPASPPIVISEFGAREGVVGGVRSVPAFRRTGDFVSAILDRACQEHVDVVHIQHAPDIFGTDDRLVRLCRSLRERRIATVVTLHSVHSWGSGAWRGHFNVPTFHRRLGETAGALVVHGEAAGAETLRAHGVPGDRVRVIPLGTPTTAPLDRAAARAELGLPDDAPILVCLGFLRRAKRLETVIRAMRLVRREVGGCRLIVAGAVQNESWRERWYPAYLRALIRALDLDDVVELRQAFLSDEEAALLYGAADVILLPYGQRYGSASMALHTALAARRLPVCSRIPKFEEVAEHLPADLLVPPGNSRAWARTIQRALGAARDPGVLARVEAFADNTAWPRLAARYATLYRSIQIP